MRMLTLVLLLTATLGSIVALAQSDTQRSLSKKTYLGQETPGLTPDLFAPGIVSTDASELNCAIAPDESVVVFSERREGRNTLMLIEITDGKWGERSVAPFSGEAGDVDPFFSEDGARLFFSSNRSRDENDTTTDSDIWYVDRAGPGKWGMPVNVTAVNTADQDEYYTSIDQEGTMYFSVFPAHDTPADIFLSRLDAGTYGPPELVQDPVSTEFTEHDPFIAPDSSYLIFTSNRPGGLGRIDLWISFRDENNSWSEPVNMGPEINSTGYDYCPILSPDGAFLFFTRNAGGNGDIYWVDVKIIDQLRSNMGP